MDEILAKEIGEIGRFAVALRDSTHHLSGRPATEVEDIIAAGDLVIRWAGYPSPRPMMPGSAPIHTPPILRELRARNHPAAMPLTNLVAAIRSGRAMIEDEEATWRAAR